MRYAGCLLGAGMLLALGAGGAKAAEADFKLRNSTGYQIDEVYVSPHASRHWGNDIMGRDSLDDGSVVKITFPHGGRGICRFDIRVKYHDDGSTAEWGDVDLCRYELISLFWDERNQVTRAVGE